jgi:hypothetical protein
VLRRAYATDAVEQAVVDGITRHGDDFVLVVEPAPPAEETSDSVARTEAPNTVAPLPAAEEVPAGRPRP